MSLMYDDIDGEPQESTLPAINMIRGLAPLAAHLVEFTLERWQVTAEVVQAIGTALPMASKLELQGCTLDSGAWRELLTLTSVSQLVLGNTPFCLMQLTAFATGIRHGLDLDLQLGCMAEADGMAFEECLPTLNSQREHMHLPPFACSVQS